MAAARSLSSQVWRVSLRAGAGDERHVDRGSHRGPELHLLVVGQRGGLAGGAGQDEAVVAVVDQPARQRDGAVDVERAVVVERRDHRREHPPEACVGQSALAFGAALDAERAEEVLVHLEPHRVVAGDHRLGEPVAVARAHALRGRAVRRGP